MAVTKQELKRARLTKKTNLRQGRRTYRLKRQEARQNLISQSGRRGFLFHRLVSSNSPAQVAYRETVSSAKKEFDDIKEEENKRFESLLFSANPYDLSHQELKHHRLPKAKARHKQARQHLKIVKEEEKAKRKPSDQVSQTKQSRFFYQAKSLDRLQAEQEVSQSKQDLKRVKTVTRHKSPKTKLKRAGRYLGREALYLASQEDDLSGAREMVDTTYQVARYTKAGIETGKATVKLSQDSTRFMVKRVRHTKERYQNWQAGKEFRLNRREDQLTQRLKRQVAR